MAKSASAPAVSEAPAPIPVAAHTRAAPSLSKGSAAPQPGMDTTVIMWDNDTQGHKDPGSPGASAAEEAMDGGDKPKEKASTPPGNAEPKVEEASEDKPTPKTAAERRADTFDRLAAERRHRDLETALKAEQGERAKEREQRESLEKRLKEGPLKSRVEALGLDADELLERLLKKDPELEGLAKAAAKEDPTIAELRAEMKAMRDELNGYKKAAGDSSVAESVALIREQTKELDIPVTRAERGYELVLRTAHEMWLAGGRTGRMADHVPEAAKRAEVYFREQRPELAELADRAARGAKGDDKGKGEAKEPGGTIGRRASARPEVKTRSIWHGRNPLTDRSEVDQDIKREYGLEDKDPTED